MEPVNKELEAQVAELSKQALEKYREVEALRATKDQVAAKAVPSTPQLTTLTSNVTPVEVDFGCVFTTIYVLKF